MRVERLGEKAAILRDLDVDPARYAEALEDAGLPGLREAVACYDTVGIYFGEGFDLDLLNRTLSPNRSYRHSKEHLIPVCYALGEDLEDVSRQLALTEQQVVDAHTSHSFRCFAVGFCPGFPYLGYLPEELSGVPRRTEPRQRIEAGSVAITGRQTGVYPLPRPGGWAILGRTPLVLVDVESRYFPIKAGDQVRFQAIAEQEYHALRGERL